jgi:hypothetical protein
MIATATDLDGSVSGDGRTLLGEYLGYVPTVGWLVVGTVAGTVVELKEGSSYIPFFLTLALSTRCCDCVVLHTLRTFHFFCSSSCPSTDIKLKHDKRIKQNDSARHIMNPFSAAGDMEIARSHSQYPVDAAPLSSSTIFDFFRRSPIENRHERIFSRDAHRCSQIHDLQKSIEGASIMDTLFSIQICSTEYANHHVDSKSISTTCTVGNST